MKANKRALKQLSIAARIAYYLGAMSYKEVRRVEYNSKSNPGTQVRFEMKFRWWHPAYWLVIILGLIYALIVELSKWERDDIYPTIRDDFWIKKEDVK